MPNTITINDVVELFNEICKTDSEALEALCYHRVPCTKELADHPTVQVSPTVGGFSVGLLGLLNGLFEADAEGNGYFAAIFNEDGKLIKFKVIRA